MTAADPKLSSRREGASLCSKKRRSWRIGLSTQFLFFLGRMALGQGCLAFAQKKTAQRAAARDEVRLRKELDAKSEEAGAPPPLRERAQRVWDRTQAGVGCRL
jgi:hypothetical protein